MSSNDTAVQATIDEVALASARLSKRKPRMPGEDWLDFVADRAAAVIVSVCVLLLMLYAIGGSHLVLIGQLGAIAISLSALAVIASVAAICLFNCVLRGRSLLLSRLGHQQLVAEGIALGMWHKRPDVRLWRRIQAAMAQDHEEHKQRQGAFLAIGGIALVLLFGAPSSSCAVNAPGDVLPFLFSLQSISQMGLNACSLRMLSGTMIVGLLLGAMIQQLWIARLNKARYLVELTLLNDHRN